MSRRPDGRNRLPPGSCHVPAGPWLGVKAVGHPTPASRSHSSLPSLPPPSRLGLPTSSPSPLIAAPHRGGTEIAEGCPQSIWRGWRQSRWLPGLSGPRAPEWLREVFGGARAALWGGGGGGSGSDGGCVGLGGSEPAGAVAMASWSAPTFSLVEYFESQTSFQCGYCKNVAGSVSNGERAGPEGVGSRQPRLWGGGVWLVTLEGLRHPLPVRASGRTLGVLSPPSLPSTNSCWSVREGKGGRRLGGLLRTNRCPASPRWVRDSQGPPLPVWRGVCVHTCALSSLDKSVWENILENRVSRLIVPICLIYFF